MKVQSVFEIFHHFLRTGDATQMLSLSDSVEIFGSKSFGDGKTYLGEQAPERLRTFISRASKKWIERDLTIRHADSQGGYGIYVCEVGKGIAKQQILLVLGAKAGKLTTFHESKITLPIA